MLFDRVALGLGGKGTTMSPSADPTWVPDLGDELYTYDPDRANQILDDAGYLDTDGDGVREMPDGSRPLEFRYAERSESSIAAPIRSSSPAGWSDIGIATDVSSDGRHAALRRAGRRATTTCSCGAGRRSSTPTRCCRTSRATRSRPTSTTPGSNDANWCSEEYDALYEQQKVELDPDRRREIVHEMLQLFNRESTYLVLLQDADMQAYRTDRFEGWLQQPADTGPVLFTNTSPTYVNLSVIGAGPGSDDGGGRRSGPPCRAPDRRATADGAAATSDRPSDRRRRPRRRTTTTAGRTSD